jgi:hypothetical protein
VLTSTRAAPRGRIYLAASDHSLEPRRSSPIEGTTRAACVPAAERELLLALACRAHACTTSKKIILDLLEVADRCRRRFIDSFVTEARMMTSRIAR